MEKDRKCKQCSTTLKGRQLLWCSEACKKQHRYHQDEEYRERRNESRKDRIYAARHEEKRKQIASYILLAHHLSKKGE